MIREAMEAYKSEWIKVAGTNHIVDFYRSTEFLAKQKKLYGNPETFDVNALLVTYSVVGDQTRSEAGGAATKVSLKCFVLQSFKDADKYQGSTQEKFDQLLDAIRVKFKEQIRGIWNTTFYYNIQPIEPIQLAGEEGIITPEWIGMECHGANWEQIIIIKT